MPCYVAITMRSDFIGDCMEFADLPEVINEGIYLVPRMTRDELKAAITGPIGVGGGTIAPRLVSRLLNDVGDDPDQLPLLQHALMRSWDHWRTEGKAGEAIDLDHYEAIGTLDAALSSHAEEAFLELDARQQKIAERMFKALTDKAADARGVRRPASIREICAVTGAGVDDVIAVVETFRHPGRSFLMPPAGVPLQADSVIDISHESLMRIWQRLSAWADEEARAGRLYLSVARAAQRHEEGGIALWRDPELQSALKWRENESPTQEWADRYDQSFKRAMEFLDESRDERDREAREREDRRKRELRRARVLALVFSTAALAMLALGVYAFVQKDRAVMEAQNALMAEQRARGSQREALRARDRAEEQRTLALKAEAATAERSEFAENQRRIAEAERSKAETERLNAVAKEREATAQKAIAVSAQKTAEEQKEAAVTARKEAEGSARETRRLSRLETARALALKVPQLKDDREQSAFLALEAYELYRRHRGNLQDPDLFVALHTALDRMRPPTVLRSDSAALRSLAVAPDGRTAFGGSEDGRVIRFDLESGKLQRFANADGAVRSIAVARDGNRVAVGTTTGQLLVLDVRNPAAPRTLGSGGTAVTATAFAPGGRLLAEGRLDGTLTVWNLDDPARVPVSLGSTRGKRITGIVFGRDDSVAAGVAGEGVFFWLLADPSQTQHHGCRGMDVRSIALSPANAVACGGARGQIVHETITRDTISFAGHRSSVNSLSYDRSGDHLASASSDGTVRIWDTAHPEATPMVLAGHDSWVWAVTFAGDRVISAGEDRTVRVWPATTEKLVSELCRAVSVDDHGYDGLDLLVMKYGRVDPERGPLCPVDSGK